MRTGAANLLRRRRRFGGRTSAREAILMGSACPSEAPQRAKLPDRAGESHHIST